MAELVFTAEQADRCRERIKEIMGTDPADISIRDLATLCAMAQVGVDLADRDLRMAELASHLDRADG